MLRVVSVGTIYITTRDVNRHFSAINYFTRLETRCESLSSYEHPKLNKSVNATIMLLLIIISHVIYIIIIVKINIPKE